MDSTKPTADPYEAEADPGFQTLGDQQRIWFRHPTHPAIGHGWSLSPIPRSGTPDTVDVVAHDADGNQTTGASVRLVMDVGEWDSSLAVNTPGQSGDPDSAHYSDLVRLWAEGSYFPLSFSEEAIERVTEQRIVLSPQIPQTQRKVRRT